MLLIKNGHIKPIVGEEIANGCVLIGDDGKITAVAAELTAPEGAQIIDAGGRLVTPGCIDAHCHVGLHDACLRWEGADYNESTEGITPEMRAIDSIYPQDEYLTDAIMGGVTSACTGPGSSNVIGGTFAVIKMYGKRVDKMIVKAPAAMKCAFGENPKNSKKWSKTRMGVAAMLRKTLFEAKAYCEAKEAGKEPKFDMKLEAMIPVIKGEIPLKCHAHRCDDILTAVRIAKEFGLKATLDHCTDGACIADELAEENFPALFGPPMISRSKPELDHRSLETAAILHKAGVSISIISDAPVKPIGYLPMYAGLCARYGLPMEEAWRAITINPANHLGVADRLGSLEPGKDADVVIWTADPLTTVGGAAYITIIDGKIVYQA